MIESVNVGEFHFRIQFVGAVHVLETFLDPDEIKT